MMRWLRVFLVLAAIGAPFLAKADDRNADLSAMIAEHRRKSQTVGEGIDTSGAGFLGTAFNEMGIKEYSCAALAFLLGKDELFKQLSAIQDSPRETYVKEPVNVLMDALLYENWAVAAESVLAMSDRDRRETWNLDCVRQYGIGEEHYVAQTARAAEFKVHDQQLHVLGDIEPGFYERFSGFLAKNNSIKYVVLGSGGGSVRDAILAGLLIRNKGLETMLESDCYSACPLLFLGGVNRTVWSPYPRLGFHEVSVDGVAVPPDHEVYALIRNYALRMGVDGDYLLKQMHNAKPEGMSYSDTMDLCERSSLAAKRQRVRTSVSNG